MLHEDIELLDMPGLWGEGPQIGAGSDAYKEVFSVAHPDDPGGVQLSLGVVACGLDGAGGEDVFEAFAEHLKGVDDLVDALAHAADIEFGFDGKARLKASLWREGLVEQKGRLSSLARR